MENENLTHHPKEKKVFLSITSHVIVTIEVFVLPAFFRPCSELEIIFELSFRLLHTFFLKHQFLVPVLGPHSGRTLNILKSIIVIFKVSFPIYKIF